MSEETNTTTEYAALLDANRARLETLASQGFEIDPLLLLRLRLDAVTSIVLAPYPDEVGEQFEVMFETAVSTLLDEIDEMGEPANEQHETDSD